MITQFENEKQNKILNSALRLFVEKGFHGTSTTAISRDAGVSTGILFHYFPTKKDLIITLFLHLKTELYSTMISNINIDNIELALKDMWLDAISWIVENRLGFKFLTQYHNSPFYMEVKQNSVISSYDEQADRFFRLGIDKGFFKPVNIWLLKNNVYNLIVSLIEVGDELGFIDEQLIEEGFNCALSSIKA